MQHDHRTDARRLGRAGATARARAVLADAIARLERISAGLELQDQGREDPHGYFAGQGQGPQVSGLEKEFITSDANAQRLMLVELEDEIAEQRKKNQENAA